jgi:hypothetical protein
MTRLPDQRPILGLDPSKRGLAFVFFVKGTPIDWGLWRADAGEAFAVLERILDTCPAEVLVIENPRAIGCQRRARMRGLLRDLAARAGELGLEIRWVARQSVRDHWANQGLSRKDAVASAIAERFPVLRPLVPRFRKIFMDEEPRSRIFDAVSLVLYAFGLNASDRVAA